MAVINLVIGQKQVKPGKTQFEVLAFDSAADYAASETEKDFKSKIIAKFAYQGDATLYAKNLSESPNPPHTIVIRA